MQRFNNDNDTLNRWRADHLMSNMVRGTTFWIIQPHGLLPTSDVRYVRIRLEERTPRWATITQINIWIWKEKMKILLSLNVIMIPNYKCKRNIVQRM